MFICVKKKIKTMDQSQLNIETNTIRIGDNQIRAKTITAVYKKSWELKKKT